MTDDAKRKRGQRSQEIPPNPWSVPVLIAQIPSTGLHRIIEPTPSEAKALAETAGILAVEDIRAEFTLTHQRGDRIGIEGRVTGHVGQTCVVTLEPLDNKVDEAIALVFAPVEQVQALTALKTDSDDDEAERPDPPEPIENGVIDLGRIATDALFLGLDPYPRKPDAVFARAAVEVDPEDHPFAALKALKPDL